MDQVSLKDEKNTRLMSLGPTEIIKVQSTLFKKKIFEFRYRVYIQEMKRKQKWADHERKVITDPLDGTGILLGAFHQRRVIGTARINYSHNSLIDHRESYGFDFWEKKYPDKVTFITKLMLEPKFRYNSLCLEMFKYIYNLILEMDAEVIIIDCNSHLVHFFQKIGFISYGNKFNHSEYGDVTTMVYYVKNEKYITEINSPMLPVLIEFNEKQKKQNKVRLQ